MSLKTCLATFCRMNVRVKHSRLASARFINYFLLNSVFSIFDVSKRKVGVFILSDLARKIKFNKLQNCWRNIALLIFLAAACFTSACQRASQNPPEIISPTREISDDLGRKIKIPEKIERAVSLAPNLTENIFAVGAGDRLVGVTSFCNYPAQAQTIQKVGDTINPNMETIVRLKPQIVFVSTASQIETFTKTLEQQNIVVFVTNPKNLEGVFDNLRQLGEIFGTEAQTANLIENLQKRVGAVEEKVKNKPKLKTFVQISREPLFTVGEDSFLTEIIERAGGDSVTKTIATAYPKLSKETASALDPETIILSESEDNDAPNDVFKGSAAVKNERVFRVDADVISRPSPRIIDALEQIAANLHDR